VLSNKEPCQSSAGGKELLSEVCGDLKAFKASHQRSAHFGDGFFLGRWRGLQCYGLKLLSLTFIVIGKNPVFGRKGEALQF